MVKSDDILYLNHILESTENISKFLSEVDKPRFESDKMAQNAFIRELEIIGEAARKVSNDTRLQNPHVLWQQIYGMRNRLVHDYLGVDLEIVWNTCVDFVPILKKQIIKILNNE